MVLLVSRKLRETKRRDWMEKMEMIKVTGNKLMIKF